MAIIKCKGCGGDLAVIEGSSTAVCEYCGSLQTIPKVDDEKKLTLFARANRLRMNCEFDKAAGIYESIVADFPEESEAYWGLVLCRYGIEYVDDPATGRKVPTCHRSSFQSVMDDPDLEQAQENADVMARRVIWEEAKCIEEIRKGIVEVSSAERPYDIFICYKETDEHGDRTLDSVLAQDIYDALTDKGYRVFFSRITLEDKLGEAYEPYIFAALNSAKIMLAVGTDREYYNAVWVKNEWNRYLKLMAADKSRHLIPCFKGLDAYDMPREFAKLQAQDMGKVGAMQDLLRGIEKLLPRVVTTAVVQPRPEQPAVIYAPNNVASLLKRGELALEDGDWQDAEGFFEEALNQDAECADAYIGKALCRERCRSLQELVEKWLRKSDTASEELLYIPRDKDHISKAVGRYRVEGYLSEKEIGKRYDRDQRYTSTLISRKQQRKEGEAAWDSNKFLARATRFAHGETADRLLAAKNDYLSALDARISQAETAQTAAEKEQQARYAEFLSKVDADMETRFKEATRQRDADYEECAGIVARGNSDAALMRAEKLLSHMGGHLQSEELLRQCRERLKELREQM